MRNALERRKIILDIINVRRHDSVSSLAFELNVSDWTIRRDVLILSTEYPIYCQHGRPGGVHFEDWYHIDRKLMTDTQVELLEKLLPDLNARDVEIMRSILKSFAAPKRKNNAQKGRI